MFLRWLKTFGQANSLDCDLPDLLGLGKKDSNLRIPESKSGALTNLATPQQTCLPDESNALIHRTINYSIQLFSG